MHFFDQSEDMLAIAASTIAECGLEDRAATLHGDVAHIPLPDDSVDLAVSRGSVFFWEDLPRAFAEIRRVLASGGWGYIGGGFGSAKIKAEIERKMRARSAREGGDFRGHVHRNLAPETRE